MRRAHLWLLVIAAAPSLGLFPARALADLRLDVHAEPRSLSIDDHLTVQISVQARGLGAPQVSLPEFEGFEVVSQQVQRPMQFSFSFGQQATIQTSTIYTFVLRPLREGKLVVKPVRAELDGEVETSQPITVVVARGSGQAPTAAAPLDVSPPDPGAQASAPEPGAGANGMIDAAEVDSIAFLRTLVTKEEPYEGEQVTVTIYLYVRDRLQSSPVIEKEPTTDGLWTHDLISPSRPPQLGSQIVDGSMYTVYALRRFAAFPLESGELTIGPMQLKIDTRSRFDIFAPRRGRAEVVRSTRPVTLRVKPLPEQGRPAGEIAVGRYTLSAKLDRTQAVTGDAVTLTAVVQGQGNVRTVALALPQVSGLDILQPEIKDLTTSPDDVVTGTREYRWLIVPRAPGRYTLPPLTLATFDPATERYDRLQTEPLALEVVGRTLTAAPAEGGAPAEPPAADDAPETEADKHEWAPIRTQSALRRNYTRLSDRGWFGWALSAPGLLWLAFAAGTLVSRRVRARASSEGGRTLRLAEQRLRDAAAAARAGDGSRFHAEASAALTALLEARLQEPVAGFTRPQLARHLRERGMDEQLASELVAALERAEFARFGSSAARAGDLDAQAEQVQALWRRLCAFAPSGEAAP